MYWHLNSVRRRTSGVFIILWLVLTHASIASNHVEGAHVPSHVQTYLTLGEIFRTLVPSFGSYCVPTCRRQSSFYHAFHRSC